MKTKNYLNFRAILKTIFPTCRSLLIKNSLRQIDLKKYCEVLIVGCGQDPFRNLFSNNINYTRSDIIKISGVTDIVADAQDMPFHNEHFDCILATELFEHCERPNDFISESYRVLIKDGVLVFSVPFLFHIHADPSDYWRPTIYAIKTLTKDFSDVKIYPQGNRLSVISDLITTAFNNSKIFVPLRIFNHLVARLPQFNNSSAPSGYLVTAKK